MSKSSKLREKLDELRKYTSLPDLVSMLDEALSEAVTVGERSLIGEYRVLDRTGAGGIILEKIKPRQNEACQHGIPFNEDCDFCAGIEARLKLAQQDEYDAVKGEQAALRENEELKKEISELKAELAIARECDKSSDRTLRKVIEETFQLRADVEALGNSKSQIKSDYDALLKRYDDLGEQYQERTRRRDELLTVADQLQRKLQMVRGIASIPFHRNTYADIVKIIDAPDAGKCSACYDEHNHCVPMTTHTCGKYGEAP